MSTIPQINDGDTYGSIREKINDAFDILDDKIEVGDVNTIGTDMIINGNITSVKILDSSITTSKIADLSIIGTKLANNAVANAHNSQFVSNGLFNLDDQALVGDFVISSAVSLIGTLPFGISATGSWWWIKRSFLYKGETSTQIQEMYNHFTLERYIRQVSSGVHQAWVKGSNKLLDEDTMSSNSDTHAPTQQSVKAYIDAYSSNKYMLVSDTVANGTVAQTTTNGTWNKRRLNTVDYNGSNIGTLSNSSVILQAGTYRVCATGAATCPRKNESNSFRSKLAIYKDSTPVVYGMLQYGSVSDDLHISTVCEAKGIITLTSQASISVYQYIYAASGGQLGEPNSNITSGPEVYCTLEITKL